MKIIITGVAGFIGYKLADLLLRENHIIYGIDNLDDYYSVLYKKSRVNKLKKYKKFLFLKQDINKIKFNKFNNIDLIIHLAAQAGVRYSFLKPYKYVETNIIGFISLLNFAKNKKIKNIIYASSSSVYGDSLNLPSKENEKLQPKNMYAISKFVNEKIAEEFSNTYNLNLIGLRFFTVFGEWGRPDMFIMKLFKSHLEKNFFYVNHFGNHVRDFTYIDDVTNIIKKLIKKKFTGHKIFNICSNKPKKILDILNDFTKNNKTNLKLIKKHEADVINTHGDNRKIMKYLKIKKFSDFYINFYKVFRWYKINKINLIT
jgi:UDP-glucuronate 4-epimerase